MKTLGSGGGFGGAPLAGRGALPRRAHLARLQEAHDVGGRASPAASRRSLHEEVADKFWSITGDAGRAAVTGRQVDRVPQRSRRLGSHLRDAGGRRRRPFRSRKGSSRSGAPQWSPDSTRIAFDANEPDHYGDRHLYVATIGADPAHATIAAVTSGRGTDIAPQWSPDGTRLRLPAHRPAQLRRLWMVVDAESRDAQRRVRAVRLDAGRRWIASQFVEPEMRAATPGPTARRCRRGCSCRRISIAPRSIRRSSGSTATA